MCLSCYLWIANSWVPSCPSPLWLLQGHDGGGSHQGPQGGDPRDEVFPGRLLPGRGLQRWARGHLCCRPEIQKNWGVQQILQFHHPH